MRRMTWKRSATMRALGKVQADQGAVIRGQIHAHHSNLGFACQALKIGLQGELRSSQHDIVHLVIF